jgi:hypothetical protein
MKTGICKPAYNFTLLLISLLVSYNLVTAQIQLNSAKYRFNDFNVDVSVPPNLGDAYTFLRVFKRDTLVFTDSVVTNVKACAGFSIPAVQPFGDYFIFSKHEKQNGKTYLLCGQGNWKIIPGGTFWAGIKHKLLFILAERDNTNLVIYSLKELRPLVEKFNCDEFTAWYLRHGSYFGRVEMECGTEPESEKELTEWMRPFVIEKYDVKSNILYESHANEAELEKSKELKRYAYCK